MSANASSPLPRAPRSLRDELADGSARGRRRIPSELALIAGFLGILVFVPISQTVMELARGERVQFTDVFRQSVTARNLRQYERTLEENSWVQQQARPLVRRALFNLFSEAGHQAVRGRDGWLFYRPDLRLLLEPEKVDSSNSDSRWVETRPARPALEGIARRIVGFRNQLAERQIALLVIPVPGKPSIYPDRVSRRPTAGPMASPGAALLGRLRLDGVATLDLYDAYARARAAEPGRNLYLARDTHWTPAGAALAAEAAAALITSQAMLPPGSKDYVTRLVTVARWGDILDMMQIPGLRSDYSPEQVACEQVMDPTLGPMIPTGSDRPGSYRFPGQPAPVLVLGDSFCRIYQFPEPRSLGGATASETAERTKRLLPGSAGFVSLLARALRTQVDCIYSDGGASTDVRRKLSTHPEILEGKKLVIWEFVERDLALGEAGWEDVPLPVKMD